MSKPAARFGDATAHGLPLAPGPGSVNVVIGYFPAWRCNLDKHMCPLPIAPPAPAPHGPETCFLGSLSVMINGQMAVRVGDMLVGAAPPNSVVLGAANVLIGDIGFGLADPANMDEFCADFAALMKDWEGLTPQQREGRMEDMANKQLSKSGVNPQKVAGSANHAPGNAQYHYPSGTLQVSQTSVNSAKLTAAEGRKLANNLYHEARHAEQWHGMARRAAAGGQSASQIRQGMGVTPGMAQSAAANPLSGPSAARNLADASHKSVYGSRGQYRNSVLNNIQQRYQEYLALPEEQDAWATGDGLPCG